MMVELLLILWAHWIADFVFQSHEMASNKSKSNKWLGLHILSYGGGLMFCWFLLWEYPLRIIFPWIILNMLLHFIVDYCTSRWTSKLWGGQEIHNFFVIIGLDQVIHFTCLFVSYYYLIAN